MSACPGSRPERTSSSSALSRLAESLPSAQITGFRRSTPSRHSGEARTGSRARMALRFPHNVLISPLCASTRNGWGRGPLGGGFVEERGGGTADRLSDGGEGGAGG